jgi:alkanesulfonate monooxygenase SsuD/methylene tetrahydromethanopterin reductase-like flavin-dependent oxidoreductase (luciferase family)
VWTLDSHVLWEEPFVISSKILDETSRVLVGPMVTNPGTRDWTVTASLFATLNEMYGNRTICGIGRGDSALRVLGVQPQTLSRLREAVQVIRRLANGKTVSLHGNEVQLAWAGQSRLEVWVAAYGPKAEHGRAGNTHANFVPDDVIDRRADPFRVRRAHRPGVHLRQVLDVDGCESWCWERQATRAQRSWRLLLPTATRSARSRVAEADCRRVRKHTWETSTTRPP